MVTIRKIQIIRGTDGLDSNHKTHKALVDIYNVKTFSKSESISNIADLISDIDLLVDVGYESYLEIKISELAEHEDIISDCMHMTNLFLAKQSDLDKLHYIEKTSYVRRADLKVEIQFLETNQPYVCKLIDIIKKINRFNNVKNERFYSPKRLTEYKHIMEEK